MPHHGPPHEARHRRNDLADVSIYYGTAYNGNCSLLVNFSIANYTELFLDTTKPISWYTYDILSLQEIISTSMHNDCIQSIEINVIWSILNNTNKKYCDEIFMEVAFECLDNKITGSQDDIVLLLELVTNKENTNKIIAKPFKNSKHDVSPNL